MGIIGYDDLAEYILQHYPAGSRIIEVGIGRHPDTAELLSRYCDFTCTDVMPEGPEKLNYVRDDVFQPDMRLYEGASLIYSIRPPVDLQDSIAAIANRVGADLLIRPFSSEKTDLSRHFSEFRCINYKRAVFFLYQNKR
ncbi:UPF0146 family protein [Methanocella arvoryzae]|uniref:UPF0146 protein RCIX280 n=1 Tax=Methanocella arvoryzae (strain DSM 22066 / NBRC 105507 / MRE50) TaxID=351160 RepID=Q0W796_METAR|nr:UPF0146 family protein [Methanocella arvoryzae]CAH04795.1 conserved hypothetical protein [uncultured archaeon]CAJ35747.1 conserved hypothetical protein [Methanocella arvoryzae MRE50]